ncbi:MULTISPECIES: serine hydrolase [unclassified Caballeronia]|uniref:serine hydrolase n=1 Tax=unclassified Caballeronia TaxID=2646786 RepID=UPI00286775AF|nr:MULTISPECIES: serine hydrolase [unclassified Caballeronia]MDR5741075.1 serine hydrolase [Caballeronia sp. LZ016]MDR5806975.1 serine hydrolase [Caballeronia sp. LZ019]
MSQNKGRRRFLGAALCGAVAGCGGSDDSNSGGNSTDAPVPDARIDAAIAQLDALANTLMTNTGVPGMSVAVVRNLKTVYAKGFGTRLIGSGLPVDPDTVFQLASLSKPVGSMVVAHQVGIGAIRWDTPVQANLPWFALSNPDTTAAVTVGDMYAHRSGLPDHAGDLLEDMGFDQRSVLERLRYLPLTPFRRSYAYTNFGLTAGALSVAAAAGIDWATLSERTLYQPLGMTSTSSRYADFVARANRATGHVKRNGQWVVGLGSMPDAQSPAGGVSSSANDMARWLAMMLGNGMFNGAGIVDANALSAAISPQSQTQPAGNGQPASYYGFGFNVGTSAAGRATYSHSGAFFAGAATNFVVVPSTGCAIVALTNGFPVGVPETLTAQFFDLVQFGSIQRDWFTLASHAFADQTKPSGSLVGVSPPASPLPARSLSTYTGAYNNDYHGPIQISDAGGTLVLTIGATPLRLPLSHWDGDTFTFTLTNENAAPGTISKVSFLSDQVTIEYYDAEGLGTFSR